MDVRCPRCGSEFDIEETERGYYTLTEADVGMATIRCFGKIWLVADFLGRVLPQDVGKRVYSVMGIIQAENEYQEAERERSEHDSKRTDRSTGTASSQ